MLFRHLISNCSYPSRNIIPIYSTNLIKRSKTYKPKSISFDPPYLSAKPPIPLYEKLQFHLIGRDFVLLESFGSYVHRFFINSDYEVENFALPAVKTTYKLYHSNSTKVKTDFELSEYRRIYRVSGIKAVHLPILLDLMYQNLPEGVQMVINKYDPSLDESRYVPRLEVEALQEELSKIGK